MLAQKDQAGALAQVKISVDIARRLAAADASNLDRKTDLCASLDRMVTVLIVGGDLASAHPPVEEVVMLRRSLAAGALANPTSQRDLAVALNRAGDVRLGLKDTAGALGAYQEALAQARALAAADPASADHQRDVAVSLWKLAGVPGSQVRWADVAGQLDGMRQRGQLAAGDNANLAEAQKRAAAETQPIAAK